MKAIPMNDAENTASGFVEVLTIPGQEQRLGYKISGVRTGPTAVISAHSEVSEIIFERLARLPTLPWMRGCIYLLSQDALDFAGTAALNPIVAELVFDEAIVLPFKHSADKALILTAAEQGYWTTLQLCTRLGIIKGRGVKRYSGPQDQPTATVARLS